MKQVIKVNGLKCSHCDAKVEQALAKMKGVEEAKANHEKGMVEVSYDDNVVSANDIAETIEDCGYEAFL